MTLGNKFHQLKDNSENIFSSDSQLMKLRLTIGLKLILISAFLIAVVVSFVTYKNTQIFEKVSVDKEEASNITVTESKSLTIELLLQRYIQKTTEIINQFQINEFKDINLNDREFISIKFVEWQNGTRRENLISNPTTSSKILESFFENKIQKNKALIKNMDLSHIILLNSTLDEKNINFILSFLIEDKESNSKFYVWALIKSSEILKVLSSNTNQQFYMLDKNNELLFSSDQKSIIFGSKDLASLLFNLSSKTKIEQQYINEKNKNTWLVTSVKNVFDVQLFSKVHKEAIFAPSDFMKQNSYYLLGMVLSIVIILVHFVAQLISNPIEDLTSMAEKVGKGDLSVKATETITSTDEVGELAKAFDEMVVGLKERDKVKNLFTKFHGTAVTKELLQSEIRLGGKRKKVTVFFSDIRGFTDFSEGHTPEEVVSMLNEYFEVMVKIINDNGGVVDKFIGDAIMAVWGVPNTSDDDTKNAINACLDMRMALNSLNEDRIERGLVPIKIGMGLHAGEAISGQIGSRERMEFTVIGDAVNTASRIEGSTKSFGTDFLISKECLEKIDEAHFIFDKAGEAKVQGKSENLVLYKVNGIKKDGRNIILETPYSAFEAVEDKKSKKAS